MTSFFGEKTRPFWRWRATGHIDAGAPRRRQTSSSSRALPKVMRLATSVRRAAPEVAGTASTVASDPRHGRIHSDESGDLLSPEVSLL